jgi:hypothetical protein
VGEKKVVFYEDVKGTCFYLQIIVCILVNIMAQQYNFLFLIASNVYNMCMYILILYETLDTKQFIPSLKIWFELLSHAIESFISFLCLYNPDDCCMNEIFAHFNECHSTKKT